MANLKFDIDAGRQTVNALTTCINNVQAELTTIETRINTLVGSEWESPSATQFQDQFIQWATQLKTTLNTLGELKAKLDQEIIQWEQTAASFGGV